MKKNEIKATKKDFIKLLITIIPFLIIGILISKLRVNFSNSEPLGIYFTTSISNLKKNDRVILENTRFIIKGYKENEEKVIKTIKGVEGDVVTVINDEIFINDESYGKILELKVIEPFFKNGDKITIPKGKTVILGRSVMSYDSRYLGFFDITEFEGKAILLWDFSNKKFELQQKNLKEAVEKEKKINSTAKKVFEEKYSFKKN